MVSDYEQSAAYAALTPAGRRALHLIEGEVERGGGTAAISRVDIERPGLSRASVNFGLKQLGLLEFVTISVGRRRINTFVLADGWRSRRLRSQAAGGSGTVAEAAATKQQAAEAGEGIEAGAETHDGRAGHATPDAVTADDAVVRRWAIARHSSNRSAGLTFCLPCFALSSSIRYASSS